MKYPRGTPAGSKDIGIKIRLCGKDLIPVMNESKIVELGAVNSPKNTFDTWNKAYSPYKGLIILKLRQH